MEEITYKIEVVEETEILVIGSGMAGVCAAIAAGRSGCSVMMVEIDEVLGGNSSPNLGVHISGAHSFHPYAAETGIINELEEEAAYYHAKLHTDGYHYNTAMQWDSLLRRMMEEAGVKVYCRSYAKSAVMDGNRIKSVIVEDLATYEIKRVDVKLAVVDASGDGQVAYTAGAEFRRGREAKSEFNERGAPEVADNITMGTSITMLVRKADKPIKFVPPPGTPPYEMKGIGWNSNTDFRFMWPTETGGNMDTIKDDHEIYKRLVKQAYSVWNYIKNEAHPEKSENWELVWISPKAGKRENRRFVGDYILNQNDVEDAREFPDAVGYGGYGVDIHDPVGDRAKVIFHSIPPLHSIPYRCLYSRNIENLFLAGRLISVTHMALGTVRLQKTLATAGQAVGVAAGLCRKYGCNPREIYQYHLKELLQLLLKNDATILGLRNEDPDDIARIAQISATSEEHFQCINFDDFLPLDCVRGIMLWDWEKKLDEVELYLMNQSSDPVPLTLSLDRYKSEKKWKAPTPSVKPPHIKGKSNRMEWGGDNTVTKFRSTARSNAMVPPNFAGWVKFQFDPTVTMVPKDPTSDEDRYILTLPPAKGIWWGRRKTFHDFAVRCWAKDGDAAYTSEPEIHTFRLQPRPPYGEAENVINGYSRRFCTNPMNAWISKRGEPFPQTLTLDFGKPQTFNRVQIAFDTIYRAYTEMPFNNGEEITGMCVKDYDIEIWRGGSWENLLSIKENYRRFRVHKFETTTGQKLRIVVKNTNEEGWTARIYEVRAYMD